MKVIKLFSVTYIGLLLILATACESKEYQAIQTQGTDESLTLRSDCEVCPGITECCCAVKLQEGAALADLIFCGTSDGIQDCTGSATGGCSSFSGGGQSILLNSMSNPRQQYCVNENSPFWIKNNHSTQTAEIIISCQGDVIMGQMLEIDIPAGQTWYYETDGDCELDPC